MDLKIIKIADVYDGIIESFLVNIDKIGFIPKVSEIDGKIEIEVWNDSKLWKQIILLSTSYFFYSFFKTNPDTLIAFNRNDVHSCMSKYSIITDKGTGKNAIFERNIFQCIELNAKKYGRHLFLIPDGIDNMSDIDEIISAKLKEPISEKLDIQ